MRILFLILALLISVSATASLNSLKIKTIQEMYEIARIKKVGSMTIFPNYASESFSSILAIQKKVSTEGDLCGTGGDDLWLSQDIDFSTHVSFRIDDDGYVKAIIGNYGEATYKMSCDSYVCTIDDVYVSVNGSQPISVKRNILNTCL